MCQHVRDRQRGLSRKGFIPKILVERSSMCEAGSVDRLSVGAFVGVKLGGGNPRFCVYDCNEIECHSPFSSSVCSVVL